MIVCVTGVTGFVASHIVKELLDNGYSVHGTVRDVTNEAKVSFLWELLGEGERDRLRLFEADLLKPNSFDEAVRGCSYVIHTASPVIANAAHPYRQLVRPAVEGTRNVLRSCARHSATVKRVIYLSSCSTADNFSGSGRREAFTEEDWNNVSSLTHNPYAYGKTAAERWAWEYVRKLPDSRRFTLLTTLPGLVLGPLHSRVLPMSNKAVQILMNRKYGRFCPPMYAPYVDVRDVAVAHRLLLECVDARGRYLIVNGMYWMTQTAAHLRTEFPSHAIPWIPIPSWAVRLSAIFDKRLKGSLLMEYLNGSHPGFDSSKLKALGFNFRFSLEDTVSDTAKSLLESGLISRL